MEPDGEDRLRGGEKGREGGGESAARALSHLVLAVGRATLYLRFHIATRNSHAYSTFFASSTTSFSPQLDVRFAFRCPSLDCSTTWSRYRASSGSTPCSASGDEGAQTEREVSTRGKSRERRECDRSSNEKKEKQGCWRQRDSHDDDWKDGLDGAARSTREASGEEEQTRGNTHASSECAREAGVRPERRLG